MSELKANLRCTSGGRDAVYQCEVVPDGIGAFNVTYNYGRYGSALRPGTKNKAPLSLEKATALFNKLVKEKLGENYQPVDGEVAQFAGSAEKRHSGVYPMLLTSITEERVPEYLTKRCWWMQEKHDGERLLVRKRVSTLTGINKKGEERPLPAELAVELLKIDGDFLIDGELVGDVYWVFDLVERYDSDLRTSSYRRRYEKLQTTLRWPEAPSNGLKNIKFVVAHQDTVEKEQFFNELRDRRAEGMVFIDPMSEYQAGRGVFRFKYKFTESATCLVGGLNGTKRSVSLLLNDGGAFSPIRQVAVGNVTIPSNFTMPHPGDLVEVRYLYAYPGGSLFQPVYLGPRTDQTNPDNYSSLKFKAGTEEDEG